jgi:hypothetical protein
MMRMMGIFVESTTVWQFEIVELSRILGIPSTILQHIEF